MCVFFGNVDNLKISFILVTYFYFFCVCKDCSYHFNSFFLRYQRYYDTTQMANYFFEILILLLSIQRYNCCSENLLIDQNIFECDLETRLSVKEIYVYVCIMVAAFKSNFARIAGSIITPSSGKLVQSYHNSKHLDTLRWLRANICCKKIFLSKCSFFHKVFPSLKKRFRTKFPLY